MKRFLRSAALLLLLTGAVPAEPPAAMRVTSAIVFKNGLAYVRREGSLDFRDGRARAGAPPAAILGTLSIAATGRVIDEVRVAKEGRDKNRPVQTIADLLEANAGRMVTLRVGEREVSGTLLRTVAGDPLIHLTVDGKVHAFLRTAVESVAFSQQPVTSAVTDAPEAMLTLAAKGADGPTPVSMTYLRQGVSWIPEYAITLLDREHAQVTMQATLINDGEELRDSRVRFAVGYPNFEFSGVPSPMTLQQTLVEFLGRLGIRSRDESFNAMSNVGVMSQIALNTATFSTDSDDAGSGAGVSAAGESSEDLFFYDRPGVTLAAGERAVYTIFSQSVPYRHVYLWTVPAETEETRNNARPLPAEQVWHSLSLTNTGTTPWTTAPGLVLANGKPVAQDTLGYTAAGARGKIKLTIATDVAVEREEAEVERKVKSLERGGTTYDALTIEGTLTLRNFKREAITLSIEKTIEGTSTSSLPEGKVTRRALRPKALNPTERLEWDVPLDAGEKKVVKYRYKVWVR